MDLQGGAMAQRKTPPLEYAEYLSADPESSGQIWLARLRLFDTVRSVYPKFLDKLSSDVLPLYRRLAQDGYDLSRLWGPKPPYNALPQGSDLKSGLARWATEFNVNVGWLMDDALRTLRLWSLNSEEHKSLGWNTIHGHRIAFEMVDPFQFTFEGWETTLRTWAKYRESARRRFKEKLLAYEKKTRELAESLGLIRSRRQYSPDNLEWFILYQFASMTSAEIADRHAKERKAVDEST